LYFQAVGEIDGDAECYDHGRILGLLRERIGSDTGYEVVAGGMLYVLPEDKTMKFFGESKGFKIGFTEGDVAVARKFIEKRLGETEYVPRVVEEAPKRVLCLEKLIEMDSKIPGIRAMVEWMADRDEYEDQLVVQDLMYCKVGDWGGVGVKWRNVKSKDGEEVQWRESVALCFRSPGDSFGVGTNLTEGFVTMSKIGDENVRADLLEYSFVTVWEKEPGIFGYAWANAKGEIGPEFIMTAEWSLR